MLPNVTNESDDEPMPSKAMEPEPGSGEPDDEAPHGDSPTLTTPSKGNVNAALQLLGAGTPYKSYS